MKKFEAPVMVELNINETANGKCGWWYEFDSKCPVWDWVGSLGKEVPEQPIDTPKDDDSKVVNTPSNN